MTMNVSSSLCSGWTQLRQGFDGCFQVHLAHIGITFCTNLTCWSWYARLPVRLKHADKLVNSQDLAKIGTAVVFWDTAEVYSAHSYSWSYPGLPDTYKANWRHLARNQQFPVGWSQALHDQLGKDWGFIVEENQCGAREQWVWPLMPRAAVCCNLRGRIRLQCGSVSLAPLVIATRTTIAPVWVSATPGNLWTVNICELQRWRTRAPTGGLTFCNTSRRRGCLENSFECWWTFPHTGIPQFLECHVTMSLHHDSSTYCRPLMATVLVPKIEWSVNLQNNPKIVGNYCFPVKYPFRQSNDWL